MLFSVIVPIYKVENYLKRCIDSILSQSCADFELILVDDGSPDGCPAICDAYAKQDARIRVIHKENGGLVSARQAGISIAQGEYVFHVDADDALMDGALAAAQEIIVQTGADLVSFAYQPCVDGVVGDTVYDLAEEGLYDKAQMEQKLYPKLYSDENMQHLFYFLWGKAIRRDLAVRHQMRVRQSISLGEDLSCASACYLEAERVYMSRQPVYYYTIRADSISTSFQTKQVTQIADVLDYLESLAVERPQDFEAQMARYSCFMCFAILAAAAQGGHFQHLKTLRTLIATTGQQARIAQARFGQISIKSKVTITLMKKKMYTAAYLVLRLCSCAKSILK